MRISEIFLLENLSINVPYHRLTTTIDHVTENELKFHVECSLNKNRLPVISFNYFCSSSFNV
jgi:hypothetical protein